MCYVSPKFYGLESEFAVEYMWFYLDLSLEDIKIFFMNSVFDDNK